VSGEAAIGISFGMLLLVYGACLWGELRASTRRNAGLLAGVPFFAWSGYESLVARVLPDADGRFDWLLLIPLSLALLATLAFRWRRLE